MTRKEVQKELAKTIRSALKMPGTLSGRVTDVNTLNLLAPKEREASSTEPSMLSSTPFRFR